MKIITDSTEQIFGKPYDFKINTYKENEKEYMSIDAKVNFGGVVCEFNIPKLDLSEMVITKKSEGYTTSLNVDFRTVPTGNEEVLFAIKKVDNT